MHHVIVSVFKLVRSFCVRERPIQICFHRPPIGGSVYIGESLRASGHQFSSLAFVITFAALWPAVLVYILFILPLN